MGYHLVLWPLTLNRGQRSNGLSLKCLENYKRLRLNLCCRHIGNHIWAFIWCHDLWPWTKVKGQMDFFSTIVKTTRDRDSFCIVVIQHASSLLIEKGCEKCEIFLFLSALSFVVFKIVEKKVNLTFEICSRSKVMASNESSYMISYMSTT